MDKNQTIRIVKQLNVTDLAGEKVMIDFDSGKYFMIKGAGNDIWELLQKETTPAEIIDALLQEYDVSAEECEQAVMSFLQKMESYHFIG